MQMVLLPGHMRTVEPAVVIFSEVIGFAALAQERGDLFGDLVACLEYEDISGVSSLTIAHMLLERFHDQLSAKLLLLRQSSP